MNWFFLYLLAFAGAAASGTALSWLARAAGYKFGLMDHPKGRKAHTRPIALTGGWGIFANFMVVIGGGLAVAGGLAQAGADLPGGLAELRHYMANLAGVRGQIAAVLGGVTVMFALGVVDDLRPLGPKLKLAIQGAAILPLLFAGIAVKGFLPTPLGWMLTFGWVIVLTNSFNLLDNMDGMSASVAMTVCLVLSLAAWQGGERWLPALFLAFGGTLFGFLVFNFHPATMFMGDSGSLTIGYLMAVFSILVTYYNPAEGVGVGTGLPVLMPLAIMSVPLFDTVSVMIIRWRNGKPLMVGDRNHFSHRLHAMGFSVKMTAVTIASLTAATGILALPLRTLGWGAAVAHLFGICAIFLVIAALETVGRHAQN